MTDKATYREPQTAALPYRPPFSCPKRVAIMLALLDMLLLLGFHAWWHNQFFLTKINLEP